MSDIKNNEVYERILNFEQRKQETLNCIYLIKDSNNSQWYKAYEWSAYLLEFITNNLPEKHRLKPIKKQLENSDKTIINVGIPITSLDKFCNKNLVLNQTVNANQHILLTISLPNNITYELYNELLNNWKNSIQIKQFQNNQQKNKNIYSQPITFMSIMKDILKFNVYGKKEDELITYIYNLKQKCADLIC